MSTGYDGPRGFILCGTMKGSSLKYYYTRDDRFVAYWPYLHDEYKEQYKNNLRSFGSEIAAEHFILTYPTKNLFESISVETWPGSIFDEKPAKKRERGKT